MISTTTDQTLSPSPAQRASAIENIVKCYGDLLFDFSESILWSPLSARLAFRAILGEIRKRYSAEAFVQHERAWVLSIACDKLRSLSKDHGRTLTPSEQIELDSFNDVSHRLKKFENFFRRLPLEDQFILLLKDKYGIPLAEIAAALGTPEGSLKIRRAQALRALEDWLWERSLHL